MNVRHVAPPLALLLAAGCTTVVPPTASEPRPAARPPAGVPETDPTPPAPGFIAPTVMRAAGLEGVIGQGAGTLTRLFGPPRLTVPEGDAVKLQWTGQPCVLDVYLYPLQPGAEPTATHVDARRASDAAEVDRAACVAALRR